MDDVDRAGAAWAADDYLTSLDRWFEFDEMEEWIPESAPDSFVVAWNLRRAA